MTSNAAFVRHASEAGLKFSVFMHPARALTEQKGIHYGINGDSGDGKGGEMIATSSDMSDVSED